MNVRTVVFLFAVIAASGGMLATTPDDPKPPEPAPPTEKRAEEKAVENKNAEEKKVETETVPEPKKVQAPVTPAPDNAQLTKPNSPKKKAPAAVKEIQPVTSTDTSTSATDTSATTTDTTASTTGTSASTTTTNGTPTATQPSATQTSSTTATETGGNGGNAPTPWPLYSFLAVIALALIGITLLATRILQRLSAPATKLEETELGRRLNKLALSIEGSFGLIADRLQKHSDDVSAKLAAIPSPDALHTKLAVLRQDIAKLGTAVETVAARKADPPRTTTPSVTDPIALEHQVLGETWKQFRANKDLLSCFENAVQESTWEPVINDLMKTVPEDLKPTFEAVTAPWREHRMLIHKISLVPRIVNGDLKRLDNDAEELRRTREYANLLAGTQSSGDGATRLNFRLKSWVTDTFLPFADLYLQRFQQSQLEKRSDDLATGAKIVRQVLRIAAVEPIDVTLGETPFDSTRHIGRSTTNDPRFSDGVITGVVRNGFIERGQQVIRQPEVIVNRTR